MCIAVDSALYRLSVRRYRKTGSGWENTLSKKQSNDSYALLCHRRQFCFFALGLGVSALGSFLNKNQMLFARIGGVIIVLFGFYQLGVFGNSRVLGKERRLPFHLDKLGDVSAHCIDHGIYIQLCVDTMRWVRRLPVFLLMAASANTKVMGFMLIGVYTVGFVLPFLAVGLFTTTLLEFFKSHMNVVKYTVKVGGALMILMGVLMFTGKMNAFTGYLSGGTNANLESQEETEKESEDASEDKEENKEEESKETVVPAIDFTLKDQSEMSIRFLIIKERLYF